MQPRTPLRRLLGPAAATKLAALGLQTADDLLRHYPRRYVERGELTDLTELRPGEHVTVRAKVLRARERELRRTPRGKRRHLLQIEVGDSATGRLAMSFFNQHWLVKRLRPGTEAFFAGKVERFNQALQLTNPEVEDADDEDADAFAGGLRPLYPATKDMSSKRIGTAVRILLDTVPPEWPDPLPLQVRRSERLAPLTEALRLIHRPESWADVARARERFRYEEAFVLQTVLAQRRQAARALPATPRRAVAGGLLDAFDARLPFELTEGQRRIGGEIGADLAATHPMHRLLQGEVGSGKTVVALRAMLTVVDAGGQCALLAPTEVLAQQHLRSITAMLGPLAEGGLLGGDERGTRVVLLTGSQPAAPRREALLAAANGEAGVVVGTHALLQEHVDFRDLGLVVVDEQHRFGVEQRDALRAKGNAPPHVLVMTATPIPRTVAITVFGDLDVSTLEELPGGRPPITTHVVPAARPAWVERTWARVAEEAAAGHRAYVVCPRIGYGGDTDDGDGVDTADGGPIDSPDAANARRPPTAVLDVLPEVRGRFPGLVVEPMYGRMPSEDKDDVMRRFAAGGVQVLVATTVIEVGVDVPEATVMVVTDADRFGISQLHQLRGRVGRGSSAGLCLLFSEAPDGSPARARLDAVAATVDGFELSRLDLEQRREGDVLGAAQSGRRSSLRSLAVVRDEAVIRAARDAASELVEADPQLRAEPDLAAAVADLLDADRAGYLEKA